MAVSAYAERGEFLCNRLPARLGQPTFVTFRSTLWVARFRRVRGGGQCNPEPFGRGCSRYGRCVRRSSLSLSSLPSLAGCAPSQPGLLVLSCLPMPICEVLHTTL